MSSSKTEGEAGRPASLGAEVVALESRCERITLLCGEVLATLRVNWDQGAIESRTGALPQLLSLMNAWQERLDGIESRRADSPQRREQLFVLGSLSRQQLVWLLADLLDSDGDMSGQMAVIALAPAFRGVTSSQLFEMIVRVLRGQLNERASAWVGKTEETQSRC